MRVTAAGTRRGTSREKLKRSLQPRTNPSALIAEPLEELREDDAGVALGAGESARGERRADRIQRRKWPPQARDHDAHRRGEIRSRVSVGDGEDIDPIQVLAMCDDSFRAGDNA
jgi:hypothetical protein